MEKFIPYEKLSKKEKRRLDAARRTTWDVSPVTRRPDPPKAYNRKKMYRDEFDSSYDASSFYFMILDYYQSS